MTPTQSERREATRAALMGAGRELFGSRGYDAVGTEEIVAAAGVTRGALYHHFDGKRGLFATVFEQIEAELIQELPLERLAGADPMGALEEALGFFREMTGEEDLQRIALLDGPAVLGWEAWHEIESRYGLGLIEASLTAARDAGQIRDLPIPELAVALLGALTETALAVARAEDGRAARERAAVTLRALLDGLREPG
jgi:AcrR family transcriptional regulator